MKKFICAVVFTTGFTQANADFIGKVVRISDGDTITVLNNQNQQIRVRFNQIDAPESSQAFGQKSRQNLSFLHEKSVYIQENSRDQYGRTLGTVFLLNNGQKPNTRFEYSVNMKQVQDGYAWAYRQYVKDQSVITAENLARSQKRGLWADPNSIPPWTYRHNK